MQETLDRFLGHCSHMPYQECTGPGLSAKGTRILSSRDPDPRSLEEVPGGGPCVRSLGTAVLLSKFLGGLLTVTQATSTEDAAVSRAWAHGCCRSPGGDETERKPEVPASPRDEALFHCTKPR